KRALGRIRDNLRDGGHFIFDVITGAGERNRRRIIRQRFRLSNAHANWLITMDGPRNVSRAEMLWSYRGGDDQIRQWRELHLQRWYSLTWLCGLLQRSGLSVRGNHNATSYQPASERTFWAHLVTRASCKIIWNASHNPSQIEAMYLESIRRFSRQYAKIFRFTVRNISVQCRFYRPDPWQQLHSNSNDRRSSRRYESALEPHPGLSVSLASRGSRPDDRRARAARHDPRRDRPRGLRSRTAPGPRPAARRSPRPRQGFRRQGGAGRSYHHRSDRAPRGRQVAASHSRLGTTLASAVGSYLFPRLRGVCAVRSARQDARGADRALARRAHRRRDRARRHRDRGAREAGQDGAERQKGGSAAARW